VKIGYTYVTESAADVGYLIARGEYPWVAQGGETVLRNLKGRKQIEMAALVAFGLMMASCYCDMNNFPDDYEESELVYPDGMTEGQARRLFINKFVEGYQRAS
jgi:hypothetical protein